MSPQQLPLRGLTALVDLTLQGLPEQPGPGGCAARAAVLTCCPPSLLMLDYRPVRPADSQQQRTQQLLLRCGRLLRQAAAAHPTTQDPSLLLAGQPCRHLPKAAGASAAPGSAELPAQQASSSSKVCQEQRPAGRLTPTCHWQQQYPSAGGGLAPLALTGRAVKPNTPAAPQQQHDPAATAGSGIAAASLRPTAAVSEPPAAPPATQACRADNIRSCEQQVGSQRPKQTTVLRHSIADKLRPASAGNTTALGSSSSRAMSARGHSSSSSKVMACWDAGCTGNHQAVAALAGGASSRRQPASVDAAAAAAAEPSQATHAASESSAAGPSQAAHAASESAAAGPSLAAHAASESAAATAVAAAEPDGSPGLLGPYTGLLAHAAFVCGIATATAAPDACQQRGDASAEAAAAISSSELRQRLLLTSKANLADRCRPARPPALPTDPALPGVELAGRRAVLTGSAGLSALRGSLLSPVNDLTLAHVTCQQVLSALPLLLGLPRLGSLCLGSCRGLDLLPQLHPLLQLTGLTHLALRDCQVCSCVLLRPYVVFRFLSLRSFNGAPITPADLAMGVQLFSPLEASLTAALRQVPQQAALAASGVLKRISSGLVKPAAAAAANCSNVWGATLISADDGAAAAAAVTTAGADSTPGLAAACARLTPEQVFAHMDPHAPLLPPTGVMAEAAVFADELMKQLAAVQQEIAAHEELAWPQLTTAAAATAGTDKH